MSITITEAIKKISTILNEVDARPDNIADKTSLIVLSLQPHSVHNDGQVTCACGCFVAGGQASLFNTMHGALKNSEELQEVTQKALLRVMAHTIEARFSRMESTLIDNFKKDYFNNLEEDDDEQTCN